MAKKVLKIDNFKGGVNSLFDARDIEDTQFAQAWNAALDKAGVVRYTGGGIQEITNLSSFSNTNQQQGFGLFRFTTDYSFNMLTSDFNDGIETGTLAAVGSATAVTLEDTNNVSTTADYYNDMTLFIYSGPGAGMSRQITDYATDRVATIDSFTGVVTIDDSTPSVTAWQVSQTHIAVPQTETTGSGTGCIADIVTDASGNPTITIRNRGNGYAIDEEITFTDPGTTANTAVIIVATIVLTTASKYMIFPWKPDGIFGSKETDGTVADADWITDGFSDGNPPGVASLHGTDAGDYYLKTTVAAIASEGYKSLGYIEYSNSLTLKAGINYTLSFDCRAQRRWFNYVADGESDGTVTLSDKVPWLYLTSSDANLGLHADGDKPYFVDISGSPAYSALESNYIDNGDFDNQTDTGINVNEGSGEAVSESSVTVTVDGTSATTANSLNKIFFDAEGGNYIGNCTARNSNTEIVFGGGISHALVDDDNLFTMDGWNEIDTSGNLTIAKEASASSYGGNSDSSSQQGTVTLTSLGDFEFNVSTSNSEPNAYIKSDNMTLVEDTPHHLNFVYASTDGVAYAVYDDDDDEYIIPWTVRPATDSETSYKYVNEETELFDMFGKKHTKYVSFKVPVVDGATASRNVQLRLAPIKPVSTVRISGISVTKAVCDLNTMSYFGSGPNPFLEDKIKERWNSYSLKFKLPDGTSEEDDWVLRLYGGLATHRDDATNSENSQTVYFDDIRLSAEEADTITLLNDNTSSGSNIKMYSNSSSSWDTKFIQWDGLNAQPNYDYVNGMLKISDGNFNNNNKNFLFYRYDRQFINKFFDYGWNSTTSSLSISPNTIITTENSDGMSGTEFDCIEYINKLYSGLEFMNANKPFNTIDKYVDSGTVIRGRTTPGGDVKWQDGYWTNWDMDDIKGKGILQRHHYKNANTITVATGLLDNEEQSTAAGTIRGQKGYKESQESELTQLEDRAGSDDAGTYTANSQTHATIRGIGPKAFSGVGIISSNNNNNDWMHNPITFWIQGNDSANPDDDMQTKVGVSKKISQLAFSFTHEFQISRTYQTSAGTYANIDTKDILYYKVRAWKVDTDAASLSHGLPETESAIEVPYNQLDSGASIKFKQIAADSLGLSSGEDADSNNVYFPIKFYGDDNITTEQSLYIGKSDWEAGRTMNADDCVELDTIFVDETDGDAITTGEFTFEGTLNWPQAAGFTSDDDMYITVEEIWSQNVDYARGHGDNVPAAHNYKGDTHGLPQSYISGTSSSHAKYSKIKVNKLNIKFYGDTYDETENNVQTSSDSSAQINFNFGAPSGVDASGWGDRSFRLATSSVNIFEEESCLNENKFDEIGVSTTGGGSITLGYSPTITLHMSSFILKDKFKTKTKFYMKGTNSDIWYLQFYVDHHTGMMYSTTSSEKVLGAYQPGKDTMMWMLKREAAATFNEVDSYESQTGISQESAIVPNNALLTCRYKTSVVANNKLYVGNIKQNGVVFGDRMIKSPIGKYNILPSVNFIDVAINDGDEITALEFYKDKLLQFKKRKVFVINTSGDYEFLEDTFDNVGVQRQCQVTKTPIGIAWVNSGGCFMYDGEKIMNLVDGKLGTEEFQTQIASNNWVISDSDIPAIGYIKSTKKLLITKSVEYHTISSAYPTMWQYDFISQGWAFLQRKQKVQTADAIFAPSNFINDENGDILWYSSVGGHANPDLHNIYKWNDSPVTNVGGSIYDNFTFTTKDYDFGNPAVRKKIYKVYVTFKSYDDSNGSGSDTAAHSNIKVYFATNGDLSADAWTQFSTNSTNYDTTNGLSDGASSIEWITAELKPTSSINNVYSFALRFLGIATNIPNRFEINDFSIVYRTKNIK